MQKVAQQSQKE